MMACAPCCAAEAAGTITFDASGERVEGDVGKDVLLQSATKPTDPNAGSELLGKVTSRPEAVAVPATAPAPRAGTDKSAFQVDVKMTKGQHPGMGLDLSEGPYLRVCRLEEKGPVPEYNAHAAPENQIRVGDFIVEVSGQKGDARALMLALHTDGMVSMSMRRPVVYSVTVDKGGGSLGLDLSYQARSTSAVIKQVFPTGVVAKWNTTAESHRQVKQDDFIIAVNGTSGTSRELVQVINDNQKVELTLARPSPA